MRLTLAIKQLYRTRFRALQRPFRREKNFATGPRGVGADQCCRPPIIIYIALHDLPQRLGKQGLSMKGVARSGHVAVVEAETVMATDLSINFTEREL